MAGICPSPGLPFWFPICSYLNKKKKNSLFWTVSGVRRGKCGVLPHPTVESTPKEGNLKPQKFYLQNIYNYTSGPVAMGIGWRKQSCLLQRKRAARWRLAGLAPSQL